MIFSFQTPLRYGTAFSANSYRSNTFDLVLESVSFIDSTCSQIYVSTLTNDHFIIEKQITGLPDVEWDTIEATGIKYLCFYHTFMEGGTTSFDMDFTVHPGRESDTMVACQSVSCYPADPVYRVFPSAKINFTCKSPQLPVFYRLDLTAVDTFHHLDIWFRHQGPSPFSLSFDYSSGDCRQGGLQVGG